jgi:hypothetical protein
MSQPLRMPSDFDRATAVHTPGGGVTFLMDTGEEERARQEHRVAFEAAAATRVAEELRRSLIDERVRPFIQQGPTEQDGEISGLSPARGKLVRHLAWLDRAKGLAAAAAARNATVADAAERHEASRSALDRLEQDVADAFASWVKFDSTGLAPDARVAELERLRSELAQTEAMAGLADAASFEVAVAHACVTELESMLPALRADVLGESTAPLTERIRSLAADLERAYGLLAAMRVATEGRSGGPRPAKVELPRLPSGPCVIDVSAEPDDVAGWHQALADLEADPLAQISLLTGPDQTESPASRGVAAACLRLLKGGSSK